MGTHSSKCTPADATGVLNNTLDNGVEKTLDPRSPTTDIARTPLQESPTSNSRITKSVDLSKLFDKSDIFEDSFVKSNPVISAIIKNHLQQFDPRSPTQEFDRTPVVTASKITELKNELKNHTLKQNESPVTNNILSSPLENIIPKKLCDDFLNISLSTTTNSIDLNNSSHNDEQKNVHEILETNFDYDPENYDESNTDTSPCDKILQKVKILKNDPRSPSVGIDRTPIVVMQGDESSNNKFENCSDDSLMKLLQQNNKLFKQSLNKTKEKINDVLIYEDDSNINSQQIAVMQEVGGSRTPLSCMKNISAGIRSKSDDEIESKTGDNVKIKKPSNIPRLRALTKKDILKNTKSSKYPNAIVHSDENTPPSSKRDVWDREKRVAL